MRFILAIHSSYAVRGAETAHDISTGMTLWPYRVLVAPQQLNGRDPLTHKSVFANTEDGYAYGIDHRSQGPTDKSVGDAFKDRGVLQSMCARLVGLAGKYRKQAPRDAGTLLSSRASSVGDKALSFPAGLQSPAALQPVSGRRHRRRRPLTSVNLS